MSRRCRLPGVHSPLRRQKNAVETSVDGRNDLIRAATEMRRTARVCCCCCSRAWQTQTNAVAMAKIRNVGAEKRKDALAARSRQFRFGTAPAVRLLYDDAGVAVACITRSLCDSVERFVRPPLLCALLQATRACDSRRRLASLAPAAAVPAKHDGLALSAVAHRKAGHVITSSWIAGVPVGPSAPNAAV